MYLGVKAVHPLPDYKLLLTFENDEQKIFDMTPYLEHGIFSELKDTTVFQSVHINFDTVEWNNGADLCPEVLYQNSINITEVDELPYIPSSKAPVLST